MEAAAAAHDDESDDVESDDDVINLEAKIKYLDQMLYWLDQVMKQISNRGFQVKSAIEWEKFINGQ